MDWPRAIFRHSGANPILAWVLHHLDNCWKPGGMQEKIPVEKSERPYFVGIDVGGTNTKIGIVDNRGLTLAFQSIPTREEKGPEDLVGRACEAVDEMVIELGVSHGDLAALGVLPVLIVKVPSWLEARPRSPTHST